LNITEAMNPHLDQLKIEMNDGKFPNYKEEDKNWLPTYKLSLK